MIIYLSVEYGFCFQKQFNHFHWNYGNELIKQLLKCNNIKHIRNDFKRSGNKLQLDLYKCEFDNDIDINELLTIITLKYGPGIHFEQI